MDNDFEKSTSTPSPNNASQPGSSCNDAGNFECNICLDLAQDPIVTLCGHLFCWPCLYKWLHHHSHSHECPVCKALVQEDKLVPLYGRGKTQTDPRSKSYPGINIPDRPAGQRPQTAPQPPQNANPFTNYGLGGFTGVPLMTARIGNFTLSTAIGGLIPALFNVQYNTFSGATVYGTTSGYPFGFNHSLYAGHAHGIPQPATRRQVGFLKNLLLVLGVLVIVFLIW